MTRTGAIDVGSPLNRSHPLAGGLAGFWVGLPNLQGSRLFDYAGGNHGTLTNGATWAAGVNGFGAVNFDGAGGSVSTSLTLDRPVTVGGWVRPSSLSGVLTIFGGNPANGGLQFRVESTGALSFVKAFVVGIGTGTSGVVVAGRWTWVMGTLDASGNYTFSANGVPAGSGTNNVSLTPVAVVFGRNNTQEYFVGDMAGMVAWPGRILSAAEQAAVYDQVARGSPDLLRRTTRRPVAYKAAAAGGNNGVVVLDWW